MLNKQKSKGAFVRNFVGISLIWIAGAAFTWQHAAIEPVAGEPTQEEQNSLAEEGAMEKAQPVTPGQAWPLYFDGLKALQAGEVATAIAKFQDALQADPKHLKALVNLTRAYLKVEQLDNAESTIDEAVQVDSNNASVHRVKGLVMHALGNDDQAIDAYERSIEIDENNPYAYNNLGLIYLLRGDHVEAAAMFEKAIALNDGVVFFYNNLGMAYEGTREFEKAKLAFQAALVIDPDYQKSATNLDRIRVLLGEKVEELTGEQDKLTELDDDETDDSAMFIIKKADDSGEPGVMTAEDSESNPVSQNRLTVSTSSGIDTGDEDRGGILGSVIVKGTGLIVLVLLLAVAILARNRRKYDYSASGSY
jgi:tetratricopeptide (TPR) repeat protein